MSKSISVYLDNETEKLVRDSLSEHESFSNGVSRLIKLGVQKQQKMSDMPMGRVIELLKVVYDKKYKDLEDSKPVKHVELNNTGEADL